MSQMGSLNGILPAAVTPFDADEQFSPAPFEALLESLYTAGVDGVYVCGGTGEGLLQTVEQRKRVAETAVRNSPKGKLVIVHVGSHRKPAPTTRRLPLPPMRLCWSTSFPAPIPGSRPWNRFWISAASPMWPG